MNVLPLKVHKNSKVSLSLLLSSGIIVNAYNMVPLPKPLSTEVSNKDILLPLITPLTSLHFCGESKSAKANPTSYVVPEFVNLPLISLNALFVFDLNRLQVPKVLP